MVIGRRVSMRTRIGKRMSMRMLGASWSGSFLWPQQMWWHQNMSSMFRDSIRCSGRQPLWAFDQDGGHWCHPACWSHLLPSHSSQLRQLWWCRWYPSQLRQLWWCRWSQWCRCRWAVDLETVLLLFEWQDFMKHGKRSDSHFRDETLRKMIQKYAS